MVVWPVRKIGNLAYIRLSIPKFLAGGRRRFVSGVNRDRVFDCRMFKRRPRGRGEGVRAIRHLAELGE